MKPTLSKLSLAGAALVASMAGTSAHALINYSTVDPPLSPLVDIPGLTGFATNGAMMAGLSVTATFTGGLTETLSWATTGAASGGVNGTGWSLSLDGDSFNSPWMFAFDTQGSLGQLTQLILNGSTGLTILDRTNPSSGTPDSAQGADFSFAGGTCGGCDANAIYSGLTSVGGAAAVGDLWQTLTVDFTGGTGPRADWRFSQDTDNDSRFVPGIPEPETYALMLGGLGLVGWVARRRRRQV